MWRKPDSIFRPISLIFNLIFSSLLVFRWLDSSKSLMAQVWIWYCTIRIQRSFTVIFSNMTTFLLTGFTYGMIRYEKLKLILANLKSFQVSQKSAMSLICYFLVKEPFNHVNCDFDNLVTLGHFVTLEWLPVWSIKLLFCLWL